MPDACYTERLDRAIALATDCFRRIRRKGTPIPYLTHLFQVMVYVGEYGGDEDQLIAAVLHDYIEDIDGADHADVAGRFGDRVADLVSALSDAVSTPKPPWEQRKRAYLAHLRETAADVKLISAADKLHNAQSIHRDLHSVGDEIWDRFTPTKQETLWYYRGVVASLGNGWSSPLLDRLEAEVRALHAAAGVDYVPLP